MYIPEFSPDGEFLAVPWGVKGTTIFTTEDLSVYAEFEWSRLLMPAFSNSGRRLFTRHGYWDLTDELLEPTGDANAFARLISVAQATVNNLEPLSQQERRRLFVDQPPQKDVEEDWAVRTVQFLEDIFR